MNVGVSQEPLLHQALFYRDDEEYVAGLQRLLVPGLAAGEPAVISVPADRHAALRAGLGRHGAAVRFLDMSQVGENPGRIIPLIAAVADEHAGRRLHVVGEPIWPDRNAAEIREATRHEALVNLAFTGRPIQLVCPYDVSALDPSVIADAECTHPWIVDGDAGAQTSAHFTGPAPPARCDAPLPAPPPDARALAFGRADLPSLRAFVAEHARGRLGERRIAELVLAVNELATNTIRHARTSGILRAWRTERGLVFEVQDGGRIDDPLAGRRIPRRGALGGRGLWLVHQLCDLVETRTGAEGTTVRLHVRGKG